MQEKMQGVKFLPVLIGLALVLVVLAAVATLLQRRATPAVSSDSEHIAEVLALSQNIPLQASAALAGDAEAYVSLAEAHDRFETLVPGVPSQLQDTAAVFMQQTGTVLAARDASERLHAVARETAVAIPGLLEGVGGLAGGLGAAAAERISSQIARFETVGYRIDQDVTALALGIGDPQAVVTRIDNGLEYIRQVLAGFAGTDTTLGLPPITGTEAEQRLATMSQLANQMGATVRAATAAIDPVSAAHDAVRELRVGSTLFFATLRETTPAASTSPPAWMSWLPLGLLGLAVLALIALGGMYASTANIREAAEQQAQQNERNQEAILRLLDELSNLADGDLTVQATVSEDITGAIADSINYAIEALRELVTTINDTAITLDGAARQTQATAGHLAKASVAQSKQIASASESVAAMAISVEEVSGNAERSSDVARHSVDIAHKGGDAVRRTIDGMNAIRETIQETSKRIKRLGESSQEIGNIVELINDIAEQTNILALNASIQASMAGEAGRGFAVVADEVQRLAERAANATKQIDVLVRTIQADTNEAVVSMERSTTDVVGGALLAENAGAALEEIEQVSNQIASLVQNISASARQQAGASQNIARNMQVLREISSQTAENTAAASTSIGKLAELSTQLRKSVAGFRLPQGILRAFTDAREAEKSNIDTQTLAARKVSGLSA